MRYIAIFSLLLCTLSAHAYDESPYNHRLEIDDTIESCEACISDACLKLFNCFFKQKDQEKTE